LAKPTPCVRMVASPQRLLHRNRAWCGRIIATAVLTVGLVVGAGSSATAAKTSAQHKKATKRLPKDPAGSFQTFCKEWMEKIQARDNPVEWQTDGGGVHGTYVEYSHEYTCTLTEETPPVGAMDYREVWYEKRGKTVAEAESSTPQPIKIFDTREIFSLIKGRWGY
jgi:hypothetical protein